MISASDTLVLPYTPDLTQAGLINACRRLPYMHCGPAGPYGNVRRAVASTAAQLAFLRHLTDNGVPAHARLSAPFLDHDLHGVEMDGRLCAVQTYLVSRSSQVDALAKDPGVALRAPALIPLDMQAAEWPHGVDLYLFAIVAALVEEPRTRTGHPRHEGAAGFWLHAMPATWRQPRIWAPLGPLTVKSDDPCVTWVKVVGEGKDRDLLEFAVEIPPERRVQVTASLYSLSHVHAANRPKGRLGIHAEYRDGTHLVGPADWHNVWLQGKSIYLLGWSTRERFRALAHVLPEGRRVWQFDRTKTANLSVQATSLLPVHELLERIRDGGSLASVS